MRKQLLLIFVALMITIYAGAGCSKSMGGGLDSKNTMTVKTEGWLDDDTFRTSAMGVAKKDETNKTKRKIQAKEAAMLMAQKTVLEKFVGARIQGASGAADGELTGIAIAKEFGGMVKGGSVIQVTYDKESQDCEIIYEVKGKNLKKQVMFGAK